jgi:hypothetical protein
MTDDTTKAVLHASAGLALGATRRTYTVFTRFRRTRLTLGRALPTLEAALSFAKQVRAVRFHDPEHVFVVDDETGETVAEPPPLAAPPAVPDRPT